MMSDRMREPTRADAWRLVIALAALATGFGGCCKSNDSVERETPSSPGTAVLCTPGESRLCHCSDGRAGRQVCRTDGAGLNDCECTGVLAGPSPTPEPPPQPATPPPMREPGETGGPWVLQIGADSDFASALYEARMANQNIGTTPVIFHVNETYVTTVGSYDSRDNAEAARAGVLERMLWRKENRRAGTTREADVWCGASRWRASPPQRANFPMIYVECSR